MFDSLNTEELEFVKAIERYKAKSGKTFPAWTDVLQILKDLGYKKTAPKKGARAEDARKTVASRRVVERS